MQLLNPKKNHVILIGIVFTFIIFGSFFIMSVENSKIKNIAIAGVSDNVSGWAWSGYVDGSGQAGIGWVSLNCINTSTCGVADYGVTIDIATENFSGYAWSSNIGWINFSPSGPFLSSPMNGAKIDLTNGEVTGWARAISPGAGSGGWDGWIKLSGDGASWNSSTGKCVGTNDYNNSNRCNYGVKLDFSTGIFSGYAWGGGTIVGWLDFNPGGIAAGKGVKFSSPIGGCDSAHGLATLTKPTSNLCLSGSVVSPGVKKSNPIVPLAWNWKCDFGVTTCQAPFPQCSDKFDNDNNGLEDDKDPGCYNDPTDLTSYNDLDNDESNTLPQCNNWVDDDNDGKIDYSGGPNNKTPDPDCAGDKNGISEKRDYKFREF